MLFVKFARAIARLPVGFGWLLLAVAVASAASRTVTKPVAKPPPVKTVNIKQDDGFKAFAIIAQRNVFNMQRGPRVVPEGEPPKPVKPPTVEAIALLGTLLTEDRAVAFFDGTSSQYRRAAQAGDTLGAYKLAEIAPDHVTLQLAEHTVNLPVRMMCRRENKGDWLLTELPDNFEPTHTAHVMTRTVPAPTGKLDYRTATPEQVRDYVSSKYLRKLEALANDPEKAEKLQKAFDKDVEDKLRKVEKAARTSE